MSREIDWDAELEAAEKRLAWSKIRGIDPAITDDEGARAGTSYGVFHFPAGSLGAWVQRHGSSERYYFPCVVTPVSSKPEVEAEPEPAGYWRRVLGAGLRIVRRVWYRVRVFFMLRWPFPDAFTW